MASDFNKEFKGKRVLILGLGLHGGGAGAAHFFAAAGAKVLVTDLKGRKELAPSLPALRRFKNISYVLGRHRKKDIIGAELIIKNPGVPESSRWIKLAVARNIQVRSDVEIFFEYCPAEIIGITGTKGKSTTAQLLAEFLKAGQKRKVFLAGNIRKSVLDVLPAVRRRGIVVLELSSFQLDSLVKSCMGPHIAVITNVFPDHLNRYKDFRNYARSKTGIFRYQKKNDYLFIPRGNIFLRDITRSARSRRIFTDATRLLRPYSSLLKKRFFFHQLPSIALAVAVSKHFGSSTSVIRRVLADADHLSGRLETVRVFRGVTFINDTTATNPGAATAALHAVCRKTRGGIILIAGGSDKKLPVETFAKAIVKFAKAVVFLPGGATEKIKSKIKNPKSKISVHNARTMKEAVGIAFRAAEKGDTILLSPGAASFGLFQHEFDRGGQFVKAARTLA